MSAQRESRVDEMSETQLVADNWQRYQYGVDRGHREYTQVAKFLDGFYLGGTYLDGELQGDGQWLQDDLDYLAQEGRPAYEINETKPAVEAAIGYQIANRMDISYQPASGDATKDLAEVRSKVAMQIAANNKLHWIETDVFSDGMIQRRGYYDVRMSFDDSMLGEVKIRSLDPMDVMPDPDANSYDPAYWADVIVTWFLTLDEIEEVFGKEARDVAEETGAGGGVANEPFGDDGDGAVRPTFGESTRFDSRISIGSIERYRIIDRQRWVREMMDVAVYPGGDVRPLTGDETPEQIAKMQDRGIMVTKRRMKRVRWIVSTVDRLLFNRWSPYDRFTVIPYFPYFRRGKTRGMVDNAVSPQMILNKAASQAIHIVNTTANSGWQMEENQLANMTSADLAENGAKSGLVLERKKGTRPLEKINSNNMPQGMDKLINISTQAVQDVTVPDALRGVVDGPESGVAIQSRQHASQQILSVPLDNLTRTRHMLAAWIEYAITKYYDSERVFRITKTDPRTGKEESELMMVNEFVPETGEYLNDLTIGEYDIVITEQPMQVTFENSQFQQVMDMRKEGVNVPDQFVIKHSNLTDKAEMIEAIEATSQQQSDPLTDAKVELTRAQTDKTRAEAVNKGVEGMYSAVQSAQQIAVVPELAGMADQMYKSAGGVDHDEPPIVAGVPGAVGDGTELAQAEQMDPASTNPLTPPNPAVGMNAGIEKPGPEM